MDKLKHFLAAAILLIVCVLTPHMAYAGASAVPPPPPLKRSALVRVATLGDSTANLGPADNLWNTDTYGAAFPGSGATLINVGGNKWALPFHYPRVKMVANGGISGQTTTAMLARDTNSGSTTRKAITDVLAAYPHVVLYRGGSINDLLTLTSGTVAATVAATYANHVEIINRLLSGCDYVIDEGIYGYTDGVNTVTSLTATRSALTQLNALFKTFAATLPGRVYFRDPVQLGLSDATGAYLTDVSNDGTHLSWYGAQIQARDEASLLSGLFGPSTGPRFDGPNIITNPVMASTGSQSYGTVAVGYGVTISNSTRANAKVETIGGKKFQTVEITATSTSAAGSITMPYDPTAMGISVGDIYGFEYDAMIDGVTNNFTPTITGISGRVDTTKTSNGRVVLDFLSPSSFPVKSMPNGQFRMHVVIGPLKYTEASAALSNVSVFTFTVTTDDQVTWKMGVANPRIVKLAQPVVTQ